MNQPFVDPDKRSSDTGDRLHPRDVVGQVLIVRPLEYLTELKVGDRKYWRTEEGSDAVKVDVITLDSRNPETGSQIWRSVLWFQNQLIIGLRNKIGGLVVGRMTKAPGQSPFVIESLAKDQPTVARAQTFLAQHPEFMSPQQSTQVQDGTQNPAWRPDGTQPTYQPPQQATQEQQMSTLDRLRRQGQQGYTPPQHTEAPF